MDSNPTFLVCRLAQPRSQATVWLKLCKHSPAYRLNIALRDIGVCICKQQIKHYHWDAHLGICLPGRISLCLCVPFIACTFDILLHFCSCSNENIYFCVDCLFFDRDSNLNLPIVGEMCWPMISQSFSCQERPYHRGKGINLIESIWN